MSENITVNKELFVEKLDNLMKALYKIRKVFRNYSKEMFSNLLVFGDEMLKEHTAMIYVTHI